MHGNLKKSQEEAHRGYQRFRDSSPEWAWRFRILEAESLLWQGMYAVALATVDSPPTRPGDKDSLVEILAIEGAANARLRQFAEADEELRQATQMCQVFPEVTCGDVIRARGVLAVQRGQLDAASQLFEQSLQFARAHNDHFLEETALLNLGLTSLREGHFDEAIDWTDAAYQASTTLGAYGEAQKSLGNLGWAYYYLGDSEKSLERSLEAEKLASQAGNVISQLTWITAAGYVYASRGDFAGATRSYQEALDLASKTGGKEAIFDAYRALALVSVESGEMSEARKYSDAAMAIARADNNRLDELYPLMVEGMIAARSHDGAEAERIFHEVEHDVKANASLKWRSEHALAQLYEDEGRAAAADGEYRAALATFETARSSLQRNESKLPFSNNAARIYDDYMHFLVARGKTDDALRWADFNRARTLAEGLGLPKGSANGPPALDAQQIARSAGGTVLFYWLGEKQSYLWASTPQKTSLFTLPRGSEIDAAVQRYREALGGPQDVLASADLDGRWLYRTLIAPAQALLMKDARVIVIPDGSLNNLNFETLLVSDPKLSDAKRSDPKQSGTTPSELKSEAKLHYWIEDATIANASSLRVFGAANAGRNASAGGDKNEGGHDRRLLLVGNSIAPSIKYPELPESAAQMDNVAKHFPAVERLILARERATPAAYLNSNPEQFSYIHFVAHGKANRLSPLDSEIVLSRPVPSVGNAEDDSFKLYARDIVSYHKQHPLRAKLVTISACYGAGKRWYAGEGLVGLSWAFLRAGAHNVIAALWDASDAPTALLMDKFYDELAKGASPDAALRAAKLSLLRNSDFRNPFYWAPFQLYARLG